MSSSSPDSYRRLRSRLAGALIALLARLPLGLNRGLGALGGQLAWLFRARARQIALHNLALCYPGQPENERHELARAAVVNAGRAITETAWVWRRPPSRWLQQSVEIVGEQLYRDARSAGRGLLLVTPHLGAWDVGLRVGGDGDGLRYFYRSPRDASLEPLLLAGRDNLGGLPLRLDAGGIREAFKALAAGKPVGILPDQEPERAGGVFAPFFGEPALTMTLLSRLASRSDAMVLFLVVVRLPGGRGWRAHYMPADPDIGSREPAIGAAAVNRSVERCIALAPEQYLWTYRRFRELPAGGRRDYRAPAAPALAPGALAGQDGAAERRSAR